MADTGPSHHTTRPNWTVWTTVAAERRSLRHPKAARPTLLRAHRATGAAETGTRSAAAATARRCKMTTWAAESNWARATRPTERRTRGRPKWTGPGTVVRPARATHHAARTTHHAARASHHAAGATADATGATDGPMAAWASQSTAGRRWETSSADVRWRPRSGCRAARGRR